MKDLIAKLKSDACLAMGGIWLHIDAREARIAELEAENTNLRYELNAALSGGTVSCPAADTDKLREAILNLRCSESNSEAFIKGFELARDIAAYTITEVALQAPVCEVPGWQPIETAPKDGQEILLRYPLQSNVKQLASYNTIHNHWESKGGYIWAIESKCEWHPLPDDLPAAPVQEPKP